MNDSDNTELRHDIARLANDMNERYQRIILLEQKYRWNSKNAVHNLAGQLFRQSAQEFTGLHRKSMSWILFFPTDTCMIILLRIFTCPITTL
jgi:hypothetical protein